MVLVCSYFYFLSISNFFWQISVIVSILIFFILVIWFYNQSKKHRPLKEVEEETQNIGPQEWQQRMRLLAKQQTFVTWLKYNFVVGRSNQKAYRQINSIRVIIETAPPDIIALIPSAQWLFDNFQVIYREIKKIKTTGTSYLKLPIIDKGKNAGYPRIYVVAKHMVAMSGGYINEEHILDMIQAYQQETILMNRELQVLPEMLGLCLLEKVTEVAKSIVNKIQTKVKAEDLVQQRVVEHAGLLDMSRLLTPLAYVYPDDIAFHSQVIYTLKNKAVDEAAIQEYILFHFPQNLNIAHPSEIFILEGRLEATLESNIRTLILSLMAMAKLDGEILFEELSYVEHILAKDPDHIYSNMDADSRGMYRQVVERLALRYRITEEQVANQCVELATKGWEGLAHPHHVGSYLLDKGLRVLKARLQKRAPPLHLEKKRPLVLRYLLYYGSAVFFFLSLHAALLYFIWALKDGDAIVVAAVLLLVLLPYTIEIALQMTNHLVTRILPVHRIPAMDYKQRVPNQARSFLAIPVIVDNKEQGLKYLQQLHARYLANPQPNIYYVLLVDYADSSLPNLAVDEDIKHALIKHVNVLNGQYSGKYRLFSLLIRSRQWNENENRYMAWERKRGKLEEFFALLNGVDVKETSFSTILCDPELLKTSRYVISLDADSNLTKDNAAKLIGTIDHPLNRAIIDPVKNRVSAGYAIIQPSVKNHIIREKSSSFPKIFSGQTGLANYPMVASDVYQDAFQEGSFVGKGIYNVQAVFQLLHKEIPENSVLSHDLLESCYAKTAFASTIDIVENFPSNYLAYRKREHRWIRGDWQLLPWIFKKKMGWLSRWKMLDNLRSSLVAISLLLFIFLNLFLFPQLPLLWLWLYFSLSILETAMLFLGIIGHKLRRPKLVLLRRRLKQEFSLIWKRSILQLIFLPTKAYNALDAIVRTWYRLLVSRKHLLEWDASDNVEKKTSNTLLSYFYVMLPGVVVGGGLLTLLILQPLLLLGNIIIGIIAILWMTSFVFAYWISQPKSELSFDSERKEAVAILKDAARKMWLFFDAFSREETNYLCPDNYQTGTIGKAANRTSPTNIGLQFLAYLSARDFGFISLHQLLEKTENLLYTVSVLPKWHGHLYNWYDTTTLSLLYPRYISAVDSGNFVGNLVALKQGLLEQITQPILPLTLILEVNEQLQVFQIEARLQEKYENTNDFLTDLDLCKLAIQYHVSHDQQALQQLYALLDDMKQEIMRFDFVNQKFFFESTLKEAHKSRNSEATKRVGRIYSLVEIIDHLLIKTDFSVLYNTKRQLFHIGFNETSQQLDDSYYDLIASESIVASFLAIARDDVTVKHWQRLGRPQALVKQIPTHISWSGTMFEYLMPYLLLDYQPGSVFYDSCKGAVLQQQRYARQMKIPWGISESQHNQFDLDSNYQYQAFGIPKLRLQPSYSPALVVAPYATMLALEFAKEEAVDNLKRMKRMGAYGEYGFYEALDFAAPDTNALTSYSIVKSFMAHHQGMSLVAINNYLHDGIMRKRFHAEPMVKATAYLLEEKLQTFFISVSKKGYAVEAKRRYGWENTFFSIRHIKEIAPPVVRLNYLSNNNYSLLLTSDGDGFSDYKGMLLHRWRPERFEPLGNYLYIKDVKKQHVWGATYHPTKTKPDDYQVIFSHHKSEFRRQDFEIETKLMVTLSLQHDVEIRKLTLKNLSLEPRFLEVTSYLELAASSYAADSSHPAFNKLFIESEFIQEHGVFLAKRRGQQTNDNPYILHMVKSDAKLIKPLEFENDRLRFVGRNKSLESPTAVVNSLPFASSCLFSTDPIMSVRASIKLEIDQSITLYFVSGVAHSKQEAIQMSDELNINYRIDDMVEQYRQQSLMEMKYLNIVGAQLDAFQNLLSPIFYPNRYFKGPLEHIKRNRKDQSGLWRFGISGDNPILLLRVASMEEANLVKEVVKAYEYFRINQVKVDLVVLSEAQYGYMHELNDLLNHLTSSLKIYEDRKRPSFFIVHAYQMNQEEMDLLMTVARIVFTKESGIYFRQVKQAIKTLQAQEIGGPHNET